MATFGMSRKFFIEALFCLLAMTMFYNLAIGNAMFESLQINVDEEEIMVHASQMPPKELKGEMHQMDVEVEAKVLTEAEVFQSVLDRAQSSKGTCDALPDQLNLPYKDGRFTNSSLPEFGVIHALSGWISKSETFQTEHKTHSSTVGWVHNLTCTLPPEKMCNVEGFSVIFMSHSLERLKELETGIRKVATWENTHEIILVWNSDPEILQHNSEFALLLQEYHTNPDHPLRIFYALQNGLENNLFNRYHPLVSPKMEVILYFDDDGPFFEEDAMNVGFELWKRDSARQVGSFPRNIRFTSDRMINQGVEELEKSIKEVEQGIYHKTRDNLNKAQSQFISTCQTAVGDKLEYNYFIFAQFQAHMMLPSGSFLHRDFLCWLWHPALEELRQFVLDHPTHPDDVTVSTIVSQLTGKAPRAFSRRIKRSRARSLTEDTNDGNNNMRDIYAQKGNLVGEQHGNENNLEIPLESQDNSYLRDNMRIHRKLLWQQENWADMREQAVKFVIGYFGSINPGSVGWCTGTDHYQVNRRKKSYYCDPEFPVSDQVPWMTKYSLGHDTC